MTTETSYMITSPGTKPPFTHQARRSLLPNQNGHHARPAMNTHSRTRSTLALRIGTFALETLDVIASILPPSESPSPTEHASIGTHGDRATAGGRISLRSE